MKDAGGKWRKGMGMETEWTGKRKGTKKNESERKGVSLLSLRYNDPKRPRTVKYSVRHGC